MRFNEVVYIDNNKIKIKIEKIYPHEEIDLLTGQRINSLLLLDSKEKFSSLNNKQRRDFPRFIDEDIVQTQLSSIFFQARENKYSEAAIKDYCCEAMVYELPVKLDLAINFLAVMNEFVKARCLHGGDPIHAKNKSITAFIEHGKLTISVYEFFYANSDYYGRCMLPNYRDCHKLIENILQLEYPIKYQPTIDALRKIHDHLINEYLANGYNNELYFTDYVNDINLRNELLANKSIYRLLDPSIPESEKLTLFTELKEKLEKKELIKTFEKVNKRAIMKLCQPCMGKQAADEGFYYERYTEIEFLDAAEFIVRPDGRMSISNLNANKSYLQHYASGRPNYDIFEHEMRFLEPIIDLEFAPDCNFHQEIIFTEGCTKKLKAMGLHYYFSVKEFLTQQNEIQVSTHLAYSINCTEHSLSNVQEEENKEQNNCPYYDPKLAPTAALIEASRCNKVQEIFYDSEEDLFGIKNFKPKDRLLSASIASQEKFCLMDDKRVEIQQELNQSDLLSNKATNPGLKQGFFAEKSKGTSNIALKLNNNLKENHALEM